MKIVFEHLSFNYWNYFEQFLELLHMKIVFERLSFNFWNNFEQFLELFHMKVLFECLSFNFWHYFEQFLELLHMKMIFERFTFNIWNYFAKFLHNVKNWFWASKLFFEIFLALCLTLSPITKGFELWNIIFQTILTTFQNGPI